MSAFAFVEAEKAEQHNVAKACALLEVSRSAFYEWSHHRPSRRQLAEAELAGRIGAIFEASRGTYGWPRVHQALRREAVHVSRERVARIMRQKGLVGGCRRRWTKTTVSDPEAAAVDLVKRSFGPGTVELDRTYVGDITFAEWRDRLARLSVGSAGRIDRRLRNGTRDWIRPRGAHIDEDR